MTLFVILVALAPAALQHWWLHRLVRDREDPALPERLLALNNRNNIVLGMAVGVIVAMARSTWWWAIPLVVVARMFSAYRLRKVLYEESWSLTGFLGFHLRFSIAFFGFWLLLLALPWIARASGAWDILTGAALGGMLLAWNHDYGSIVRWLMRTQPLTDDTLLSRFATLVERSGIPPPRFEFVHMRGGFLPNAVALASLRGSSVVFTNTFLERLETDEIVAVCAHEIAHLEHFNPVRLQVLSRLNIALIAAGIAAAPLARLLYAPGSGMLLLVWPVILLAALMWLARDRQQNETKSDLRAVALCGDADALASGLTRLHVLARVPRRWNPELEKQATHPSLARRLRDIRAAAGTAPGVLKGPQSVTAPDGTTVTFDDGYLRWQESDAAVHQFTYAHLAQLRVDAPRSGAPQLVAVETTGRKWHMPLPADSIARVQHILDVVDDRLSSPAPAASRLPFATVRVLLLLVAVIGTAAMHVAFTIVAVIAAIRPAMSMVAAAGVAALAGAALALRDNPHPVTASTAVVIALMGAGLLALAWQKRKEDTTRGTYISAGVVAILSLAATMMVFMHGPDAVRVHQGARAMHGGPVLLFALATLLACRKTPVAWASAAFVGVFGASIAAAGSMTFLERVGRDPLFVRAPAVAAERLQGPVLSEMAVPYVVSELRVSPGGQAIAVRNGEEDEEVREFQVGLAGVSLKTVNADDIAFVSETGVLAIRTQDRGVVLQHLRLDGTAGPARIAALEGLAESSVSFDPASEEWEAIGWERGQRVLVRAQGAMDGAAPRVTRWNTPQRESRGWVSAVATSGDHALTFIKRYERGWLGDRIFAGWHVPLVPMRSAASVWRLGPQGASELVSSKLETECTGDALPRQLVCATYDDVRTTIVSIDPASGATTPIGSIEGRFVAYSSRSSGWLTGWHQGAVAAFDLSAGRLIRGAGRTATTIAAGRSVVAIATYDDEEPVVRVISLAR